MWTFWNLLMKPPEVHSKRLVIRLESIMVEIF